MKTRTIIILVITFLIIYSLHTTKKTFGEAEFASMAAGELGGTAGLEAAELASAGAGLYYAKKSEDEDEGGSSMNPLDIVGKLVFNKWALLALVIVMLFVFGGSNFIFSNPIIIVFGVIFLFFMMMGGKRR